MLLLPYLYERQIGSVRKTRPNFNRPDLDCLLSRLVCGVNDVFTTRGEDGIPVPPFACKFRKDKESDLLAVANEDGEVYLIDTDKGKGVVKNFTAHNNAIFDICWLPDRNGLLTGSGDFRCCLFDMHTCKKVSTFKYHKASIKCIDVFQDGRGTTLALGSKDRSISIWDIREDGLYSKPAIVINQSHERTTYNSNKKTQTPSSVSAVTFKDSNTLASAGVGDSVIKIWDLRKTYDQTSSYCRRKPINMISFAQNNKDGYTSLVFNSLYTKLYACSAANKIFEIDCHSYTEKYERFIGLKSSTSYFVKIALSHDDQYIASGSTDNKAYIWKTSKPGLPLFELAGHTAEVTSVAWGAYNNTKVATCGDDHKVLVWKTKYSDHTHENPDQEQVAASRPYSCGSTNDSSESISIFLPVTPMNHIKKGPNYKSPPASNSIRSYFSPLPPTPVSHPHFTQSPSSLKRGSPEPQTSQSPSSQIVKYVKSQSNHNPPNLKTESAEPQTSQCSSNQSRNPAEPHSVHSPSNQIVKFEKLQRSQSASNLTRDSITPQSSNNLSSFEGGSGHVYPTIFRSSFGNPIILSASVSPPPQSSHSPNTKSATPHTIFSPGTESEDLSSSVSAAPSEDISGDTIKVNMHHQPIQSRANYNEESTSDSQNIGEHATKKESDSIPDSPQSKFTLNGESASALYSNSSLSSESTEPQSGQCQTKPIIVSTSNSLNGNSTQSSSIPSSPTPKSSSMLNSTNSKSAKPQFSDIPSSTSTESASITSPHFKNSLDIDSTQISRSLSSPMTESASNPHSPSNIQQSCNGLSTPTVQREPLSPRKNIQDSSGVKGIPRVGKENGSSVKKSNGQTKRKLDVNDRACKNHLDGCGRSRGKTRCGKRIVAVPEKNNLTDYFSVIQTPDKHQNSAL